MGFRGFVVWRFEGDKIAERWATVTQLRRTRHENKSQDQSLASTDSELLPRRVPLRPASPLDPRSSISRVNLAIISLACLVLVWVSRAGEHGLPVIVAPVTKGAMTSKLLTAFDAPTLQTMCLHRPIRDTTCSRRGRAARVLLPVK